MPHVKFTKNLQRFFPTLKDGVVEGETVAQVVVALDQRYPGLAGYIVDERGTLRKHVNIFVGDTMVEDRQSLQDAVNENSKIFVFQALSGG
jgi:sulfur-carrier protein